MTYIKTIAGILILIGLFDVFAFSRRDQLFQNIFDVTNESFEFEMLNAPPPYQNLEVTEDIAYQQLFRLILSLEKQADKQAKGGNSRRAEFLRSYLQRKAGLTFEQAKVLKDYALNFSIQFGCISKRGEFSEKSNGERSQALLEYRNRIRRLLGEVGFDIFHKFVQEKIASRMTYTENSATPNAFFGFSYVDYDPEADEVVGSSYTEEPPGHCNTIENIVYATLSSDAEGMVDSDSAEVCDGRAEVYLYFSAPQPEDRFCVDGEHYFVTSYGLPLNAPRQKLNRGMCYSGKWQSLPPSEACVTTPALPNVTSVTYQVIQAGSIEIDANPNTGAGQRIFPDDNTPNDGANRRQIRVTAQISENRAGVPVYFRNFDLDDPSDDTTIDPNGNTENDNNGNVGGSTAGQLSATSATTNGQGIATVNFTVTMQPGDNFAIAAGTDDDDVAAVTVDGTALINGGASIDVNCDGTDTVCRSEMLTVWRRVHIEVDSMGNVQDNGQGSTFAEMRKVGVSPVEVQINHTLEVNRFQNGRLVYGATSFIVDSNTATSVTIRKTGGGTTIVQPGFLFTMYDDDNFDDGAGVLNGDNGENIPDTLDTSMVTANSDNANANVFAAAYVRPVYDAPDTSDNNTFHTNAISDFETDLRLFFTDRNSNGTNTDPEFWTVYLLNSYQHTLIRDNDPSTEIAFRGIVDAITGDTSGGSDGEGSGALIYQEVIRAIEIDDPSIYNNEAHIVAHEIGHLFSAQHTDGDLMGTPMSAHSFSPTTIRRIRILAHP